MKARSTRRPRFSDITRGIRLRLDQEQALSQEMVLDPELDASKAIRRGLDLFLAERKRLREVEVYPVITGSRSPALDSEPTHKRH